MKKLLFLLAGLLMFMSLSACAVEKRVVSNACVLAYSDIEGKVIWVIKAAPIVIFVK